MNGVKFFCQLLLVIWPAIVWAKTPVEVISGGVRYSSFEAYASQRSRLLQEEEAGKKQLRAVSYEQGVNKVAVDFNQDLDKRDAQLPVPTSELENRLGALADGRKEPVLVVSDPKKLRVMSLEKWKDK